MCSRSTRRGRGACRDVGDGRRALRTGRVHRVRSERGPRSVDRDGERRHAASVGRAVQIDAERTTGELDARVRVGRAALFDRHVDHLRLARGGRVELHVHALRQRRRIVRRDGHRRSGAPEVAGGRPRGDVVLVEERHLAEHVGNELDGLARRVLARGEGGGALAGRDADRCNAAARRVERDGRAGRPGGSRPSSGRSPSARRRSCTCESSRSSCCRRWTRRTTRSQERCSPGKTLYPDNEVASVFPGRPARGGAEGREEHGARRVARIVAVRDRVSCPGRR